jgi:hypothetical protein
MRINGCDGPGFPVRVMVAHDLVLESYPA